MGNGKARPPAGRPDINILWRNRPGEETALELVKRLGGGFNTPWARENIGNGLSCAVRLSAALNATHVRIPDSGKRTLRDKSNNFYFFGVDDMREFLRQKFGPADETFTHHWSNISKIKGIPGIIVFEDHIDLWDGMQVHGMAMWQYGPANFSTQPVHFWMLPGKVRIVKPGFVPENFNPLIPRPQLPNR